MSPWWETLTVGLVTFLFRRVVHVKSSYFWLENNETHSLFTCQLLLHALPSKRYKGQITWVELVRTCSLKLVNNFYKSVISRDECSPLLKLHCFLAWFCFQMVTRKIICFRKHYISLPYLSITYISFHVVSRYEKIKFDFIFCSLSFSSKPRNFQHVLFFVCQKSHVLGSSL